MSGHGDRRRPRTACEAGARGGAARVWGEAPGGARFGGAGDWEGDGGVSIRGLVGAWEGKVEGSVGEVGKMVGGLGGA